MSVAARNQIRTQIRKFLFLRDGFREWRLPLSTFFTSQYLPSRLPVFEPESDQLGHYCQTITQMLMSHALPPEQVRVMEDLLGELVSYYADVLNAPRWITAVGGLVELN